MNNTITSKELVIDPSKLTKSILIDDILGLYKKHEDSFQSKRFFTRFKRDIKIKLYLEKDYLDYYEYLRDYKFSKESYLRIIDLQKEFKDFYNKLIFNNFALVHIYIKEGSINNPVLTKEDDKNIALSKLYYKKISIEDFQKEFGHYALNAYELKEKRFSEYDDDLLKKIAYLAAQNKINKSITLREYINSPNKEVAPILICLRELAKYQSLKIVANIRFELL